MKRVIRLTESDLVKLVKRIIKEQKIPGELATPEQKKMIDYVKAKWNIKPGIDQGYEQNSMNISLKDQKTKRALNFDYTAKKITFEKPLGIDPSPISIDVKFPEFKAWFDKHNNINPVSAFMESRNKNVRRVIKEQSQVDGWERVDAMFECTGLKTKGAGWTAQVMEIESSMPELSTLMGATDDFNFKSTSNWKEDMVIQFLTDCSKNPTLLKKMMEILTCYFKKMNIPMEQNNPILTLAKKTFKTNLGVTSIPDIGGKKEYDMAKTLLSKMGMKL